MNISAANQPLLFAKSSSSDLKEQIRIFNGQILLNPAISRTNFFCYLLFTTYLGLILLPVGLLQASVLGVVYKLDTDEQASVTSAVQLIQLVLQLLIAPWIGLVCDKYGRKILVCSGLTVLCLTVFLTPNFPSPYPYYIINQCLQGISCTALIIPPLLADYIDKSTHGRMAGLSGVLVNTGAFFMTSLSTAQDTEENLRKKFFYLAIIASSLALVVMLGLKGGSYHHDLIQKKKSLPDYTSLNEDSESVTIQPDVPSKSEAQPGLMAGIQEAKNPWIFTGYVINFLMMSSVGLTSFALVTYVIFLTEDKAKANLAYALVSKFQLSATICSAFFGFFSDKLNKFKLIIFTVLCSITSIILLILIKSPTEPMAYISMVFFGVASSGFLTFSNQLLNRYASPHVRGSVLAFGGMVALVAGASINILGVYLLHWNVRTPFFMYSGYSVIGLIILVILYIRKKDILNQK